MIENIKLTKNKGLFKLTLTKNWYNKGDNIRPIFHTKRGRLIKNPILIQIFRFLVFIKLKDPTHFSVKTK